MGKTAPTSIYFLTDQLLDRLPAVCPIKISDPDYLLFNFIAFLVMNLPRMTVAPFIRF